MNDAERVERVRRGAAPDAAIAAHASCRSAATCERIRYLNSTGTSVNDSSQARDERDEHRQRQRREQIFGGACSRKTGTKTMQIDSVESNVGRPTSAAPSTIAVLERLAQPHMPLDVFDHDRGVVDQDADRQRKAAERHGVERLPADIQHQTAVMIDSGIDARMISVSRQLPRNSRIISAVSPAAISPPISTLLKRRLDEDRLVEDRLERHAARAAACGSRAARP